MQGDMSLECRDLRHSWEHVGDTLTDTRQGNLRAFDRHLVCMRCATERIDSFVVGARWIGKTKSRYKYPKDYKIEGKISLPEVRYRLFKGFIAAQEKDSA